MSVKVSIIDGLRKDPATGAGGANEGHIQGFADDLLEGVIGGVRNLIGNDAKVIENDIADMYVQVSDGVVYVPNEDYDSTDIRSTKFWRVVIKDEDPILLTSNSSGSTRVDLVAVRINKAQSPGIFGDLTGSITTVIGTPGAGAPSTPGNYYALASVSVINGETDLHNSDITDLRAQIKFAKRFIQDKRKVAITSSATPTPNSDTTDIFDVTALAAGATFAAPTGSPVEGQTLIIRIKDNGVARSLAFNAAYRFSTELIAPTTTIIDKTLYMGFIYNSSVSKWDCLAIVNNF
ncbi:MAG: hypothetical protein ACEQR7_09040 [Agathobacter rectalis]